MFNEGDKTLFLKALPTDDLRRMYTSIFNRTKDFESERNKDIYTFDMKECMGLVISLNPKSTGHIGSLLSQFSKYTDWAIKAKLAAKNFWSLVPVDEDYARYAFANRNVKDLDELINIVEIGLSVPHDKVVVYLLYSGIMGDGFSEISLIKDDDVDRVQRIIQTTRRKYADIIKPLFDIVSGNYPYYEEKKQRDYESLYLVKPYKTKRLLGEPIGYQHVHRVFQKLNKKYNSENPDEFKQFTPTTIWRSGLFNSLYNIERLKGGLVPDDYAHVNEVYGNHSFGSYTGDYELYKKIFWSGDI